MRVVDRVEGPVRQQGQVLAVQGEDRAAVAEALGRRVHHDAVGRSGDAQIALEPVLSLVVRLRPGQVGRVRREGQAGAVPVAAAR